MLDLEVTLSSLMNNKFEISLGSPFCHCVTVLKQFDDDITQVQVWYSDQSPLGNDLVLDLHKDGIRLFFDSYNQRLKMIEVYEMDKLSLKYHGKYFNSPSVPPTIEQINQSFGSTTPCKPIFDENKQRYMMNFRGLAFFFSADDAKPQPGFNNETGYQRLSSPSGIIRVTKMQICDGPSGKDCKAPEIPLSVYNGVSFLEKAVVERSGNLFTSLKLTLRAHSLGSEESPVVLEREITFGLPCQEVASRLGAPTKIFYKCDDRMKIHSPDELDRQTLGLRSDYIYNYFSLGIDLVFDGTSHKVKKVILHTNYPGHYDFNIYMRCHFTIPLSVDFSTDHRMSNPYLANEILITPYTKWNEIEPFSSVQTPVVLRRWNSLNSNNPFGPTFCFGVHDMIFEVMKNMHIASVTIYQTA